MIGWLVAVVTHPLVLCLLAVLAVALVLLLALGKRTQAVPAPFAPELPIASEKDIRQRFTAKKVPSKVDAIVIGSGIGGLAAAVSLSRVGWRVLVLEQHDIAGGSTHAWLDKGFEFDSGMHYLGISASDANHSNGMFFNLLTDYKLKWATSKPGDVYDTAYFGNDKFEFPAGDKELTRALKQRFPKESDTIDWWVEQLSVQDGNFEQLATTRLLPRWLAMWAFDKLATGFRKNQAPLLTMLRERTKDEQLIAVLTCRTGNHGVTADKVPMCIEANVQGHYMQGACYPEGGGGMFARCALPVIEKAGGKVLVAAGVKQLLMERGKCVGVQMEKNDIQIRAPVVISNTGVITTFTQLLPSASAPLVAPILASIDPTRELDDATTTTTAGSSAGSIFPSVTFFNLFIGFDATAEQLGLPANNLWLNPSWDMEAHRSAAMASREACAAEHGPIGTFASFPAGKDPSYSKRFPGKSNCIISADCRYEWFKAWKGKRVRHRGQEYSDIKAVITEKLLGALLQHMPHLREHIVYKELGTSLSMEHYLASAKGCAYGAAHTAERYNTKWLHPTTPIPGLYLAGQDVLTAGVVAAALGGFFCAANVSKRALWDMLPCIVK